PSSSLWDYGKRVYERHDDFQRYVDSGVFHPESSTFKNYALFCLLQRPTNTQIDAVEFLKGAQVACDRVINGTFSAEVRDYVTGKESVKPAVVQAMETMFEPACYQRHFLPRVRYYAQSTDTIDMEIAGSTLEFTGVHLTGVSMRRMTLAKFKKKEIVRRVIAGRMAELQKTKTHNELRVDALEMLGDETIRERLAGEEGTITEEDAATMVERLRLSVVCDVLLSVDGVHNTDSDKLHAKTNTSYLMCFESLVTRPDEVDWRIENLDELRR
ncbi:hypothetical protein PHYSODRAFT_363897, partial [Phytophthora sojae]